MDGNLKMKNEAVVKSLVFKYSERMLYQGIAFAVQIIIARLLDPSDYGVLAILSVFIVISQVFVQSGLNTALIQRKSVSEEDYSTVFWASMAIAILLYAALFAFAPLISQFYEMPELIKALRIFAVVLIPGAFNSIQNAKIAREMQFKQLMYCTVAATIISGSIGIAFAHLGYGIWALVAQQISNQIAISILLLFVVKWYPKCIFNFPRFKALFSFGWKLLLSSLLNTIYGELQNLAIGKKYKPSMLGYFNRGRQFPQVVVENINGSIQAVMLPVLSKEQDNRARMKNIMRRSVVTSSFILFPMMVGLAVVAEPLVSLLLTDKWLPCVPYLRVYCFVFAFYPIHTANLQALNAQGRSDWFLKLEIIKKVVGGVILITTVLCFDSPLAIALGAAVSTLLSCFINSYPNKSLLDYSYVEQMRDILPSMALSLIMGVAVYPIILIGLVPWLTLIIQLCLGVGIYVALAYLFKLECFEYLINLFKQTIKNRSNRPSTNTDSDAS